MESRVKMGTPVQGLYSNLDLEESTLMPTEGYWEWKDKDNAGLKYVPLSHVEKGRSKTLRGTGGAFAGKDDLIEMMKKQGIKIPGAPITVASLSRNETAIAADQKVTLELVKEVALRQSEVVVTPQFERLIQSEAFHHFIWSLLRYFNEYFKILEIDQQPRGMVAEMSAVEKLAREEANRARQASKKALGFNYSVLILGLELPELHHMECGNSRVSSQEKDRIQFEKLYTFCIFIVWVCFRRKDIRSIRIEMGRILKSNYFNAHARKGTDAHHTTYMDRAKMSETSFLKSTAEANKVRKDLVKKPPIMSIVGQKSPALTSLLPSTKEQALWLFEKLDSESVKRREQELIEAEKAKKKSEFRVSYEHEEVKVGIIGESLKNFNSATLIPLDNEKKVATDSTNDVTEFDKEKDEPSDTVPTEERTENDDV